MASLWKRSNSPYWVCCYTAPDGTQLKRSTKETDRHKAWLACVEIERAARLGRQGQLTEVQARKIISDIYLRSTEESLPHADTATFLREWITSKEVTRAEGTALRYKRTVEDFLTFIGKRAAGPLSGIAPRDITRFRDEQRKLGKSPATANMAVKTLRVPFALARRQGLILNSPADAVEMLPSESETRDTFTLDQLTALPPRPFEEESVLFYSINEKLSDRYVEVYAPVHWTDHAERTAKLKVIIPLIKEIIVTTIGTAQPGGNK